MLGKGHRRDGYGDGAVRILTVSRSAGLLSYSFTKCHRWEKLGRECMRSIVFLATACESAIISKLVSYMRNIKPQATISTELHRTLPRPLRPPRAATGLINTLSLSCQSQLGLPFTSREWEQKNNPGRGERLTALLQAITSLHLPPSPSCTLSA